MPKRKQRVNERAKKAADAEAKRVARENETPEEKQQRQLRDAIAHRNRRQNESETENEFRRTRESERQKQRRGHLTADAREQETEHNTNARRNARHSLSATRIENYIQTLSLMGHDESVVEEHFCGLLDVRCEHCNSKNFAAEKPTDNKFTKCCQKGKVSLEERDFPLDLQNLMSRRDQDSKEFLDNIRAINSSFAFASMGADMSPPPGYGPYCFRIHGQIYHRTGTLHPEGDDSRKYAQLYILDPPQATVARLAVPENKGCNERLFNRIGNLLQEINPFAKSFKMLHEVEQEAKTEALRMKTEMPHILMAIKQDRNKDVRRYNNPRVNEVAIIFENTDGEPPFDRDLLIHLRPDLCEGVHKTKRVNILDNNLDPMVYPLFFPRGEQGWGPHLELRGGNKRTRMSQMMYYSYQLSIRDGFNPLLNGGKLTQQYIVDAYVKMEANRLNFVRTHQQRLRAEKYSGLVDHLNSRMENDGLQPGRMVILPSSFEGSPRNMQQRYQDAMSIVTKFGKPDLFVTMTCNPKWKEITENLLPWQKVEHRPDLVARVFQLKLKSMLEEINAGLFGNVIAMVHVIEFQKRGLSHAHILIILDSSAKIKTEDIDRIVSAEIPDAKRFPRLFEIVARCMIHTPCGSLKPGSPCMKNGKCSKQFPKELCESTSGNVNGYPKYKREKMEKPVLVDNKPIDNSWVVPYNAYLLLRYNCHINVEICASIQSVKYLFKYVYKGHDCANVEIKESTLHYDEPAKFVNSRYVSAPEACWRIFDFSMHKQSHAIIRLAIHLPEEQTIYFNADNDEELEERMGKLSTLMAWFELNMKDPEAHNFLYMEIPQHYVFKKGAWEKRQRGAHKIIGRMYSVSVKDHERYFLRLNLLHVKGATSFETLKTVNSTVYQTFREAAKMRGLLLDDSIWKQTLEDAAVLDMPRQLRDLFAYICIFGSPSEPINLWNEYKLYLIEDYCNRIHQFDEICSSCEAYALKDIQSIMSTHGKCCGDFGLPAPPSDLPEIEIQFNIQDELHIFEEMRSSLNTAQLDAFEKISEALEDRSGNAKCFFLDGPGGSGKTYLYTALIHFIRAKKMTVQPSASTGIAANLLVGGRTMHSSFGLPVPLNETSVSRISPKSAAAKALRNTNLFVIDECTMASNHALNTIDKLLKEITGFDKIPFGGKVMLLGGDFRQCLAIIPHALRQAIVQGSLIRAESWKHFQTLKLVENMRSEDPVYSDWLLKLGDGVLTNDCDLDPELIEVPVDMLCSGCIIQEIYGNKITKDMIKSVSKRAILCPKNDDVDKLNEKIINLIDGEHQIYYSDDSVVTDVMEEKDNFPVEFLNSVTPSGMPNHRLKLKEGCIIMLLRNLNQCRGLCNGTRLIVTGLKPNIIQAEVLTGSAEGEVVFIPRIDLCPSETGLPFKLNRRQFPVKPAFAMTINKSQGQTLDRVGMYLAEPVFAHGQLYVAFSRVRRSQDVKVKVEETPLQGKLLNGSERVFTPNVVYQEVF